MGVVRREGDWRLEKRAEGVYEITYQNDPQVKVLTSDHRTDAFGGPLVERIPVREVDGYAEVEGLFEEKAHGPGPLGTGFIGGSSMTTDQNLRGNDGPVFTGEDDLVDVEELPPGGFALSLILAGGLVLYVLNRPLSSLSSLFAIGMLLLGSAILGWGAVIFRRDGAGEAFTFLFNAEDRSEPIDSGYDTDRTPPLSQRKKDILYLDRADEKCEWCGDETNTPEVHHIKPREEGGPNTAENLIVLCPNCHREKPDLISRSKFRRKVRRQIRDWDGF